MPENPLTAQDIQDQLNEITEYAEQENVQLTPEVRTFLHDNMERVLEKLEEEGNGVTEKDIDFLAKVRIWIKLPEEVRISMTNLEGWNDKTLVILKSYEAEAKERGLSLSQFFRLVDYIKQLGLPDSAIDTRFNVDQGHIMDRGDEGDFNYTGIIATPEVFHVQFLRITNSPTFKQISKGLHVSKALYIENNPEFETIQDGLKVRKTFVLENLPKLTELPEDIELIEFFGIKKCPNLKGLPRNLEVENLRITHDCSEQVKKDAQRLVDEGKIVHFDYYDETLPEIK